ncbi:MAG: hypothetical protein QF371_02370, partial [Flavobacteriales bacterium]|nr:hypothetical protein [Flavobacteriales bacterium]
MLVIAPLLFLGFSSAIAQKNFTVRHFDKTQGLSSNFIEAVTQSSSGHLIIATKGGLDRFEGRNFQNLKSDTGLLEHVTSVHQSNSEICFGLFDGNIGKYAETTGAQIFKTGINGQIKHIYKDDKDGVWAFSRSGMVFWTDATDTCRYDMAEHDMLINAVIPYKHKEFIIGSNDGLLLVRFESGNEFQILRKIEGLSETKITALKYESHMDMLWVGTEDAGLHRVFSPFSKHQKLEEFKLNSGKSVDDVQTIFTDHLNR